MNKTDSCCTKQQRTVFLTDLHLTMHSHLNEGSVSDLTVESFDVWGQVHVQQQVIL